ncbi:MAG TPA: hypothetical protein VG795_01640, partial [Acidimicrobiia bacterium]|nr:hypothetical protein [Acidimicrobiia bacterium]
MRGPATAELLADLQRFSLREGDFTLASGRQSKWYLDARQVTYRGDCLETVGRAVLEAVGDLAFDAVGGLTLGADPVALAVAVCSGAMPLRFLTDGEGPLAGAGGDGQGHRVGPERQSADGVEGEVAHGFEHRPADGLDAVPPVGDLPGIEVPLGLPAGGQREVALPEREALEVGQQFSGGRA